jgi:hypothetical protein
VGADKAGPAGDENCFGQRGYSLWLDDGRKGKRETKNGKLLTKNGKRWSMVFIAGGGGWGGNGKQVTGNEKRVTAESHSFETRLIQLPGQLDILQAEVSLI